MTFKTATPYAALLSFFCLVSVPATAHPHRLYRRQAGMTYCTFYRDRLGTTASNLFPRGTVVLLSRGGTAIRVRITDRGVNHFDLTPSEFRRFAPLRAGVVRGVRYRVLSRR